MENKEFSYKGLVLNGFLALLLVLGVLALAIFFFSKAGGNDAWPVAGVLTIMLFALCMSGFIKLEPNEAKVLVFFGKYSGTFTRTGFYWVNPLLSKKSVSLRARNLNPEPIKVNDKAGNPVLIGMVLVWKLEDTYKALFEIDSQSLAGGSLSASPRNGSARMLSAAFENFVRVQSDAALRQVAGCYAYDNPDTPDELTLRSNADEINEKLVATLNERLNMAGLHVTEARINYLAYAPEIAAVMLRRQQADAIIA
ncbi:MAG: SPFH domain-containing protein, partial [Victivallales bacterium]|nr:SPFH domain-containing protein [Victivallales bacterium]